LRADGVSLRHASGTDRDNGRCHQRRKQARQQPARPPQHAGFPGQLGVGGAAPRADAIRWPAP